MPSISLDQSVELDRERIRFVDDVMFDLGFRRYKTHESHRGAYKFTDLLIYLDDDSGDSIAVGFPNQDEAPKGFEITIQAEFNNKSKSPDWHHLDEFQDQIASWIEECCQQ